MFKDNSRSITHIVQNVRSIQPIVTLSNRVVKFIVAALDDAGREGATVVGPGREIWFEFLKNSNSSFTKLEYSYPIWMVCEGNLATRSATSDEAKLKAIEEMGSPIEKT